MKKIIILLTSFFMLTACGNNTASDEKTATGQPEPPKDPEAEKGLELVAKSDCFQCHKVAEAFTGPAYEAVAAKYPNNDAVLDSLSQKIIKGGAGNWGTIPMTPHPGVSKEDARTMVKYVLSLKK